MELIGLYDLIKYLEYGTNLHIGVVFLNNTRNIKCTLPVSNTIHSKPICELFKKEQRSFEKCLRCRNFAIRKAVKDREAFGGHCINGVYEYTSPLVIGDKAVAVVYVGNILTKEGREKLLKKSPTENIPFDTMHADFDITKCEQICGIIAGYIETLLEKYPDEKTTTNPIIENIKGYVADNLEYELSISHIATLYFYNEVYLGRLFKEEIGKSFKEYVNQERVKLAKRLLTEGKTVIEAANKSGYNNVSYFNRVFKKQTGFTPGEYKKR